MRDCESDELLNDFEIHVTFCTGDPFYGEGLWTCSGAIDADGSTITCTFTGEVAADCLRTRTLEVNRSLSGDIIRGEQTLRITYDGPGCVGLEPRCTTTTEVGYRLITGPDCYEIPVHPTSWSEVKVRFR